MCLFRRKKAKKVAEPVKEEKAPVVEEKKEEVKEEKPAPKKAAPAPKKASPKAKEAKPAPKKEEKKAPAKKEEKKEAGTKVYHVAKRAEDQKWTIKFASGKKVIKTFDTKAEAVEFAEKLSENQDGVVLTHASKGKKAGKINAKL